MARAPDPEGFLPLHPLELRILMALTEGPSYGTRIVRQIEEREAGGTKLYPANLYRRIRDLLGRTLIEEGPAPDGADPRRTYLRLTDLGRAVARAEVQRLRALLRDAEAHDLLVESER